MINPQKVGAMSRKAKFEQAKGREALRIKKYCEDMPVWKSLTRGALAGVLLYLLLMFIAVMTEPDFFIALYNVLGKLWSIVIVAVTMAICVVAYTLISDTIFRNRFRRVRSTLCGYKSDTQLLEKISQGTGKS